MQQVKIVLTDKEHNQNSTGCSSILTGYSW